MTYFHPRDFDPGQPLLKGLPLVRRFKSYYGLSGALEKVRRLLAEFPFTDIRGAEALIDWDSAPTIELS
jgi:peptidoglycan-N-acetylglucosamine deacetylase